MGKYLMMHTVNSSKENINKLLENAGKIPLFEEDIPNVARMFNSTDFTVDNFAKATNFILAYIANTKFSAMGIDLEDTDEQAKPKNIFKEHVNSTGISIAKFADLYEEWMQLEPDDRVALLEEEESK